MIGMKALLAVVVTMALAASLASSQAPVCPCSDTSLCQPIQSSKSSRMVPNELFLFQTSNTNWQEYDWNAITTIVLFTTLDPAMLCHAHLHGVRVVLGASYPADQLGNGTYKTEWINSLIAKNAALFTDGVNIDFEDPIESESQQVAQLNNLVEETATAFRSSFPDAIQITFDVAWSSNCIDGRCYDYKRIAELTDFLFIMAYDIQSQILPPRPCIAYANSPLLSNIQGIHSFLRLGISPKKLVLGSPWYAYDYPCKSFDVTTKVCEIEKVPFRGVNCSDAAGSQLPYSDVLSLLRNNATSDGRHWDPIGQSPFFQYKHAETGIIHQVRYDDPQSLILKYHVARDMGLRGIGMWAVDFLPYHPPTPDTRSMWRTFANSMRR